MAGMPEVNVLNCRSSEVALVVYDMNKNTQTYEKATAVSLRNMSMLIYNATPLESLRLQAHHFQSVDTLVRSKSVKQCFLNIGVNISHSIRANVALIWVLKSFLSAKCKVV